MVKSKFFLRFVAGVMAAAASCFVMAGCSLLPQQEESSEESVVSEEVSQIPAAFPAGTEVKGVDISGMTVTEDRLKNIDFTNPYTTATQVIIVRK